MNLKPVVTSLFLMGLACGSAIAEGDNGNDLMTSDVDVVDATVDVSDVNMNQDAGVASGVSSQVTISGKINVDYSQRDFRSNAAFPYFDSTGLMQDHEVGENGRESDGRLGGNAQLNIDADLGDNNAHLGFLYSIEEHNGGTVCNGGCPDPRTAADYFHGYQNPGSLLVIEAYVKMLNLGGTPLTLKFGHGFTDFGKSGADQGDYERFPVVRSLTQSMTQTSANYLQLGMSDLGMKGVHLSGYVLDHKNANSIGEVFTKEDARREDKIGTYGVNLGYNFFTNFLSQEQWGVNFSYVTNPGAVELVEQVTLNPARNGALSLSAHLAINDAELGVDYVKYGKIYDKDGSANDRRTIAGDSIVTYAGASSLNDVFGSAVTSDDAPSAFDVNASYSFRDTFGAGADTKLSVGYGHGQDSVRLLLPQSQMSIAAVQGLGSGANLAVSYVSQTNYDKKDNQGNALQVNGEDMKGATNHIVSLRLSYDF